MKHTPAFPHSAPRSGPARRVRPENYYLTVIAGSLALLAGVVQAFAVPAPAFPLEAPAWTAIAKDTQPALIAIVSGSGQNLTYVGFFISKDGHALCALGAVIQGKIPREVCTSDKTRHPFGSIMAVFPDAELALVKINHHPDKWLEPPTQPVALGTEVAVLGLAQVPPVHTGKRSIICNAGKRLTR